MADQNEYYRAVILLVQENLNPSEGRPVEVPYVWAKGDVQTINSLREDYECTLGRVKVYGIPDDHQIVLGQMILAEVVKGRLVYRESLSRNADEDKILCQLLLAKTY